MTDSTDRVPDTQAVLRVREVDRIATCFEHEFRRGGQPRIESFLQAIEDSLRSDVLRELVALEIELRNERGESADFAEYEGRFGAAAASLRDLFDACPSIEIEGFEIGSLLGEGGFGRVYEAYDRTLDRKVAIKVLDDDRFRDDASRARLLAEARAAAKLQHAAIVPVYQVGRESIEHNFVVFALIEGESLADRLRRGTMPLDDAIRFLTVIADAVHHAHCHGIIHRDLKPANILLRYDGQPFVTDFGLALDARLRDVRSGEIAGSPHYMAPEQAAGESHRINRTTDVWALGVMLYEMLSGQRPFGGDTVDKLFYAIRYRSYPEESLPSGVSPTVTEVISRCLAKQQGMRYATAKDVADALRSSARARDLGMRAVTGGDTAILARPRGLRNYGKDDAAFFGRLLGGPRDRFGLPLQLRFWKGFLENRGADHCFPIGVLFGASGSGKTSFVQAGLLPRLDAEIVTVSVEANVDDTEVRLIKALRRQFPELEREWSLPEIVAHLRERAAQKIILILDQFEQWLHVQPRGMASQLVDGIRQCDGIHVQALVIVREEFWIRVSEFMRAVDTELFENRNAAPMQLLEVSHAKSVLKEFGQAYDRRPDPNHGMAGFNRFVDQAIGALSDDGVVVPIRLALLTETVRELPWSAATFDELGGVDGIAVRYLESTFDDPRSDPTCHKHRVTAHHLLAALLPPDGQDLRGEMRSFAELFEMVDPGVTESEFSEAVNLLDSRLRLITPTHPEGEDHAEQLATVKGRSSTRPAGQRYYQLSHDYLIPAIRAWTTRKKRESLQGRAELCLAERTQAWSTMPSSRQLPTWLEWLTILLLTRLGSRTDTERRMLRHATKIRLRQAAAVLIALVVCTWSAYELRGSYLAKHRIETLLKADIQQLPALIDDLSPYRRWANPRLQQVAASGETPQQRLHAQLATLPRSTGYVDQLASQMLVSDPDEFFVIAATLWRFVPPSRIEVELTRILEDRQSPERRRLRAGAFLASGRSSLTDSTWRAQASDLANLLTSELAVRPTNFHLWLTAFRTQFPVLEPSLVAILADNERSDAVRNAAATLLAGGNSDDIESLVEHMLRAEPEHMLPLVDELRSQWVDATPLLENALTVSSIVPLNEADQVKLARRRASAAVLLVQAGADIPTAVYTAHDDPTLRSLFIDRLARLPMSSETHATCIERALEHLNSAEVSARFFAAICLGHLTRQPTMEGVRGAVIDRLRQAAREDVDGGVHSAASWALRQWDELDDRAQPAQAVGQGNLEQHRRWYVAPHGQTMIVIPSPELTTLGTPDDSDYRQSDEAQRVRHIDRTFAIATTEVTVAQFLELMSDAPDVPNSFSRLGNQPANAVTWYDAAKYCRLLSEAEGIPEDEMCYPPVDEIKQFMKPYDDYLHRSGYRLPTEAEWEYACRAGSRTAWTFGSDSSLMGAYGCYVQNSLGVTSPVGTYAPNVLGIFDMHGNVREWCQDRFHQNAPAPADIEDVTPIIDRMGRMNRGGSFATDAGGTRSANRRFDNPATMFYQCGFRIARTMPTDGHD